MKSYALLHENPSFHYLFSNGVFIVLSSETSIGFFIDKFEFEIQKLLKTVETALTTLRTHRLIEIKLIGELNLLQKIAPLLNEFGPVKTIPRIGNLELLFYPQENRTRLAQITDSTATLTVAAYTTELINPTEAKTAIELKKTIRVLIVDDSNVIRTLLKKVLNSNPRIEIVADTGNPLEVIQLINEKKPDVITLDIHMPNMDGITLLKKYINTNPIPTVMITSVSMEDGQTVLNALEAGAVDYIKKPEMDELSEAKELIIDKVISAASATVRITHPKSNTAQANSNFNSSLLANIDTSAFIAIGASTGGTEALRVLLTQLPEEIPPILIVQHIPAGFSAAFAKRLDSLCPFEVIEGRDHDEIKKNRVIIAPGGHQMRAFCRGHKWHITIDDSPPVNRHKPSVDYLFDSLLEFDFKSPVGIILTGMGGDGAKGLLNLKNRGWKTIAQDKNSSVVFGMPAVAIDLGAVEHVCSINDIPKKLRNLIPSKKSA